MRFAPVHFPRPVARVAIMALAACALWAPAASATVLYKSIGPHGVVQFSDTPPEQGVVIEERIVGSGSDGQPIAVTGDGSLAFQNPLEISAEGSDPGPDLARANQQVDLAEHALALARSSTWTRREGLSLSTPRRAAEDNARIAHYEQSLRAARAQLLDLLNRGQARFAGERNGAPLQVAQSAASPSTPSSAFHP